LPDLQDRREHRTGLVDVVLFAAVGVVSAYALRQVEGSVTHCCWRYA
jgi:hypothetical protein